MRLVLKILLKFKILNHLNFNWKQINETPAFSQGILPGQKTKFRKSYSLYSDTFCQIARLINITTPSHREMVGKQLQWNRRYDGGHEA